MFGDSRDVFDFLSLLLPAVDPPWFLLLDTLSRAHGLTSDTLRHRPLAPLASWGDVLLSFPRIGAACKVIPLLRSLSCCPTDPPTGRLYPGAVRADLVGPGCHALPLGIRRLSTPCSRIWMGSPSHHPWSAHPIHHWHTTSGLKYSPTCCPAAQNTQFGRAGARGRATQIRRDRHLDRLVGNTDLCRMPQELLLASPRKSYRSGARGHCSSISLRTVICWLVFTYHILCSAKHLLEICIPA